MSLGDRGGAWKRCKYKTFPIPIPALFGPLRFPRITATIPPPPQLPALKVGWEPRQRLKERQIGDQTGE